MESKTFTRGDKTVLTITASGDYTSHKLSFGIKKSFEPHSARLVTKRNSIYGGGDTELSASHSDGTTTFSITLLPLDTALFTPSIYYADIIAIDPSDDTNSTTLKKIKLYPIQDVQTPYDSTTGDELDYTTQEYDRLLMLKIDSDGTGSKIKEFGWNVTPTFNKESLGVYRIVFDSGILDLDNYTFDIKAASIDSDSLTVFPVFVKDIVDSQTLKIGVYDLNSQLVVDTDFLLNIRRVRV